MTSGQLTGSLTTPPFFELADELKRASKHCATLARAKTRDSFARAFVPKHEDPTATVSFVRFEGKTYAVTAAHVIEIFQAAAKEDGIAAEGYFVPVVPGIYIGPPFVRPLSRWPDPAPDVALRQVHDDLPAIVGKRAFELKPEAIPEFPIPYALAVGFPTAAKQVRADPLGERLAMVGVFAVAEGVGSADSDQVQFWSDIPERPAISKLSGMSGGPVFWSKGESCGLLGFVKEAADAEAQEGVETLTTNPKVNFICQRAAYETFGVWAEYADREFTRRRDEIGASIRGK